MRIELRNRYGITEASSENEGYVVLTVNREYEEGDFFVISGSNHLFVTMDSFIAGGEVFAPSGSLSWIIPFGENRNAYCPYAFSGNIHCVSARAMTETELKSRRCLSCNPSDLRGNTDFFPHAYANVETRNESCFAARNVIDGMLFNTFHGVWPFQSWGIGTRNDAWCEVDLGRLVVSDCIAIVLRADFPHDSWWKSCKIVLDDVLSFDFDLKKTGNRQDLILNREYTFRKIKVCSLEKADDPSPFPSLTQLEVYGSDI